MAASTTPRSEVCTFHRRKHPVHSGETKMNKKLKTGFRQFHRFSFGLYLHIILRKCIIKENPKTCYGTHKLTKNASFYCSTQPLSPICSTSSVWLFLRQNRLLVCSFHQSPFLERIKGRYFYCASFKRNPFVPSNGFLKQLSFFFGAKRRQNYKKQSDKTRTIQDINPCV